MLNKKERNKRSFNINEISLLDNKTSNLVDSFSTNEELQEKISTHFSETENGVPEPFKDMPEWLKNENEHGDFPSLSFEFYRKIVWDKTYGSGNLQQSIRIIYIKDFNFYSCYIVDDKKNKILLRYKNKDFNKVLNETLGALKRYIDKKGFLKYILNKSRLNIK